MGAWDVFWGEGLPVIKRSPFAGIVLVVSGVTVGVIVASIYFNDKVNDQKELIARLKIAAGISQPIAKTSIMELTNNELKSKSSRLVSRIREILQIHHDNEVSIKAEHINKSTKDDHYKLTLENESTRAWNQFETIRADAVMVSDELRARLSPHVHEKIITARPHFHSTDDPKAELSMTRLAVTPSFPVVNAMFLAEEIEELSKLQLERLETCAC